jgi:CHAT domain-containing protein
LLRRALSFAVAHSDEQRLVTLSAGWLINSKAVVQEALAEGALLAGPQTAPLVERLRVVRRELAALAYQAESPNRQQNIAALETEQEQLIKDIGSAGTGMSQADPWISTGTLRDQLPPGSVFVNMYRFGLYDFQSGLFGPDKYVAWIVPAADEGQVHVVELGDAAGIDAQIQEARAMLESTARQSSSVGEEMVDQVFRKGIESLASALVEPLLPHLANANRIILSPDGALWLVPWAALPAGEKPYLLEGFQIDYVTSGRELIDRRVERTSIGPPVVMANPAFDVAPGKRPASDPNELEQRSSPLPGRVAPLPGTETEAAAIRSTLARYARAEPTVHLGDTASEASANVSRGGHGLVPLQQTTLSTARSGNEHARVLLVRSARRALRRRSK